MSEVRLIADLRTEFGKGGARRLRRAGKIPAVIYGHGAETRHVSLPEREFNAAIRHGGVNVLLTLSINGKDELALPKSIQRHPIKNVFEHVDLVAVRRGEKVTIDVPVVVVGDVTSEGLVSQVHQTISVEAPATNIPTQVEIDVTDLEVGAQVLAGDIKLPSGSTLAGDAEVLVLSIAQAQEAEVPEEEVAEEEGAEGEAAEGEEGAEGEASEGESAEAGDEAKSED